MKAVILYRPVSEHAREVDDYVREFKMRTGKDFKLVSTETKDGANLAKLYDIMSYPAVLVTDDDGKLQKLWTGEHLPLYDEVQGYMLG
jgi:hypothetical protein